MAGQWVFKKSHSHAPATKDTALKPYLTLPATNIGRLRSGLTTFTHPLHRVVALCCRGIWFLRLSLDHFQTTAS